MAHDNPLIKQWLQDLGRAVAEAMAGSSEVSASRSLSGRVHVAKFRLSALRNAPRQPNVARKWSGERAAERPNARSVRRSPERKTGVRTRNPLVARSNRTCVAVIALEAAMRAGAAAPWGTASATPVKA